MFPFKNVRHFISTGCKMLSLVIGLLMAGLPVWAKGAAGPPPTNGLEHPLAITLLIIIVVLALVIALLAWVVNGAAEILISRYRKAKSGVITALILGSTLVSGNLMAQDAAVAASVASEIGGLDSTTFFLLTAIIGVELIAILYLLFNLQRIIKAEVKATVKADAVAEAVPAKPKESWWARLNRFKPVEQEADIDLGHDYDGIRELDNRLPPWWLYGFYICIIFSVIYLWRFHVTHSGPSSEEEYKMAMAIAEKQKEEYLKKAANNIDENTVVMMDGPAIAAGEALFVANCAACHGKQGEGTVGPNLTDDYWLHGGSIRDIFKTIKYGVPEKGMRSWQEDLSPVKIAQISSYIRSLRGTNPPNAKEKQGEFYVEEAADAAPADSTAVTQSSN